MRLNLNLNKKSIFLIAFGLLFLLILLILIFSGKPNEVLQKDPYAWEKTEIETKDIELPFIMDPTRTMTKEMWGKASLDPYEIVLSNDPKLDIYNIYPMETPSYIVIVPNNIEYEFNIEKVVLNHKEIRITYSHGNPNVPRMIGHQQIYDVNVFYISTEFIEDDTYTNKMIDTQEGVTFMKKLKY